MTVKKRTMKDEVPKHLTGTKVKKVKYKVDIEEEKTNKTRS